LIEDIKTMALNILSNVYETMWTSCLHPLPPGEGREDDIIIKLFHARFLRIAKIVLLYRRNVNLVL
jgi:hypothetical protein